MVSILQVARDFETDNVPSSGKHKIRKAELREWGAALEAIATAATAGAVAFASKAVMDASLAYQSNTVAWVVSDATAANNGIYQKVGGSGVGYWQRLADLPYGFIYGANAGTGTSTAIEATTVLPIPATDGGALVSLPIVADNAGAPVTVSFNGSGALTVKTAAGNDVAVGGLKAGMIVLGFKQGANFRLLSDQSSAAIQAAAEAALADLLSHFLGAYADDTAATAAAGGSPVTGQLYWNTTTPELRVYDGGWVSATQAAATITNGSAVGDGFETDFALPADAEATNTHIYVDGRRIMSGYTLTAGALSFSEAIGDGVPIDWDVFDVMPLGVTTGSLVMVDGGQTLQQKLDDLDDEIEEISAPFIGVAPARPEEFGAVGDGVANDTAAVQAALDAGRAEVRFDGAYSCGALTLAAGNRLLFGRGTVKQRAVGTSLFVGSGLTGLVFSVNLYGAASLGTTPESQNDAINLTDCDDITVEGCRIEMFRFRPIFGLGGKRWRVANVDFVKNAVGPRFGDVEDLRILDNLIDGTCLAADQFTTGIGLESTDGFGGRTVCRDVWITRNRTKNIVNAQAILVHGGICVSIADNKIFGAVIPISLNPYNTTDYITYPSVTNNHIETFDGTWAFGSVGNSGVVCQAGPASGGGDTPRIINPKIHDNTIISGNRSKGGAGEGGIQLAFTDQASIVGNEVTSAKGNGIVMIDCLRANVGPNVISNVLAGSGSESNGILAKYVSDPESTNTGSIHDNVVYGATYAVVTTSNPNMSTSNNVVL